MSVKKKKNKSEPCCVSFPKKLCCCKIESLITVDERGQMILPKELRKSANIKAGDKFALISWEKHNKVCCISLIKAEEFVYMVKDLLSPMMKEIIKEKK